MSGSPRVSTRSRRGRRLLGAALVLVCWATLLGLASPAVSATVEDPSADRPRLPARCLQPGYNVPTRAGACHVTRFVKTRPTLVMWGDSHMWQHLPSLRPLAREQNVNLVLFFLGACPPLRVADQLPPDGRFGTVCERHNYEAMRFVRKLERGDRPLLVLLGAFWQGYRQVYQDVYVNGEVPPPEYTDNFLKAVRLFHYRGGPLFRALGRAGVPVDVVGQSVRVPEAPRFCAGGKPYDCTMPRSKALPQEGATRRWLHERMGFLAGRPRYIDFNGRYCDAQVCQGRLDDVYTFYDYLHLSATRSATLRPYFAPSVRGLR